MLTKLIIKNFKRFESVEIELGDPVVFIGPNNLGKTTALQALALWEIGLRKWNEKRRDRPSPKKRSAVTINRKDLIPLPVPEAKLLWCDLHVREVTRNDGKQKTENVRVQITLEGVTGDRNWRCGLEFDYANVESLYCRPLRISDNEPLKRMPVPEEAESVQLAFLPPMSGLAANEDRLDTGAVNVRIGEGRTAEVLRNLCFRIHQEKPEKWQALVEYMKQLFGARLKAPLYIAERGEIVLSYQEGGLELDLSCSGRGLQQTLLLLSYMYSNPGAVLLLDEPDAHLEILRQRQIYQLLTDVARENGNQIIAASHSEVLLNEAAGRDVVVAFVGSKPHRINDRGGQVLKALRDIGFEHYYLAEQTGWVLYLEGSMDLAILRAFAKKLDHMEAIRELEMPFVHFVSNQPSEVQKHFFGLQEAVPYLKGVALFDRLDQPPGPNLGAHGLMWRRREIENYLCQPETLENYAVASGRETLPGPLFEAAHADRRRTVMREAIEEVSKAMETLGKGSPLSADTKASEDFLIPLFRTFFHKLGLYNVMDKKNFHELAHFVPREQLDPEITENLDAIVVVAASAKPRQ